MSEGKVSGDIELARASLPDELLKEFETLVEDYRFAAHVRYGKRFVSYLVLADLIKAGWRRVAEPIEDKQPRN